MKEQQSLNSKRLTDIFRKTQEQLRPSGAFNVTKNTSKDAHMAEKQRVNCLEFLIKSPEYKLLENLEMTIEHNLKHTEKKYKETKRDLVSE